MSGRRLLRAAEHQMQEGKVRNRRLINGLKKKVRKAHTTDEIRVLSQVEYSRSFQKHVYQKQKDESRSQKCF